MFTLAEQVGQLFLIGLEGSAWDPTGENLLNEFRPGGVIFFRHNITTPPEFSDFVRRVAAFLSQPSSLPPFLALDLEGGTVDRLRDVLAPLPSARDAAQAGLARDLGRVAGRELAAFSLNVDFAPVLDLGSPESRVVLGSRTAGESPEQVARFGEEFLAGLAESGVLGCGKHFPGLGSGRADSHQEMPRIEKDERLLWQEDLYPFRALASRLPMVMVAHAAYPGLEIGPSPGGAEPPVHPLPASLSRKIVAELLKERIGFPGLVLADDMEMGGVLADRSIGEAAVCAIRAGCDLMLVCRRAENVQAAFESVLREAERDSSFRVLVEQAAQKVVRARQKLPPAQPSSTEPLSVWEDLRQQIRQLAAEIERRLVKQSEPRA